MSFGIVIFLASMLLTSSTLKFGGPNKGDITPPLSQTSVRRLHQLALLKSRILSRLNLPYPPSAGNKTNTKTPLSSLVLTQLHYGSTLIAKNSHRTNADVILSEPTEDDEIIQFSLTGDKNKPWKRIKSVHLFMRMRSYRTKIRWNPNKKRKKIKSRRMKILVHGFHPKRNKMKRIIVKQIKLKREKWLSVKLPVKLVNKMTKNSQNNTLTLKLTCKRCEKWARIDLPYKYHISNNGTKHRRKKKLNDFRPYIIVRQKQKRKSARTKRELVDTCQEANNMTSCCTRVMDVSFAEIGWDKWILFPSGFSTGVCIGSCRYQGCSPTHYSDLTIMYYRTTNIISLKTIPDFIEGRCACL